MSNGVKTVIQKGTKIIGKIISKDTVCIDGELEGSVRSSHGVIIDKNGQMKGSIHAKSLEVFGKFEGDIECESAKFEKDSEIKANIKTDELEIMPGARFEGKSDMNVSKDSYSSAVKI